MYKKFNLAIETDISKPECGIKLDLDNIKDNSDIGIKFLTEKRKKGVVKPEELIDIDAYILIGKRKITEKTLEKADRLKWIGRFGAGFNNVDIDACSRRGILVSNAPQGVREPVAEMLLAYMTALATNLISMNNLIRKQGFEGRDKKSNFCLYEKKLGIIGFGGIAKRLVELVKPINMNIYIYDPYVDGETVESFGGGKVDLDFLLKNSDFISINVPLTKETQGMLGKKEFKKMKKTAYLINASRGMIYKDTVLAEVLEKKWIAGAAIDVFEDEPYVENNPLLDVDNAILTPHIAGAGINVDAIKIINDLLVQSVLNIKNNKLPLNILNPEAVEKDIPLDNLSPSFRN